MIPFPTFGEDTNPESPIQKIIAGAFGIPIELDAAPTTAGGELPKHGDTGFYGTDLYINLGGSTYKYTGTLV